VKEISGMLQLQKWAISFAAMALAVAASYFWLDRPIAFFSHDHFAHAPIFVDLTLIPEFLGKAALLALVILGFWRLAGMRMPKPSIVIVLCSVSLIVAEALKNELKNVFGRTWPETWINGNPSLIHDGSYGFNFFHGGVAYASFPSGHTTAICAVASVLWICYPKLRLLWGAVVAAVVIGLIGADYHFLGDTIAGGFLGTTTGWCAVLFAGKDVIEPEPPKRPVGFLH
jgi:membrane-associated phospholipid phosphatase